MSRDAVFRSWNNPRAISYRRIYEIPDHIGTAVNVQLMVFGNTGDTLGHGRRLHPQPRHGREGVLRRVPRQRAGRGRRRRHPHAAADRGAREVMPKAYKELRAITTRSRSTTRTCRTSSSRSRTRSSTCCRRATASARVRGRRDRDRPRGRAGSSRRRRRCCRSSRWRSRSCCAGLRPGRLEEAARSRRGPAGLAGRGVRARWSSRPITPSWAQQGKKVLLVRKETVPDDIHGMEVAQGVLTATGGMTSHAAVVGRQMGKPSVVGAGASTSTSSADVHRRRPGRQGRRLGVVRRPDRRGQDRPGRQPSRARSSRCSPARWRSSPTSTAAS
jgi:pyruvate, orthophosphate dikinase